ncbi:unnamed protein product [Clavelina lepadiformis]|uniref:Cytochrome P450 n=1 Tax=Clavelina lepadiformis TaxID=159417 RepID=A0ABP0EZB0_CLALP
MGRLSNGVAHGHPVTVQATLLTENKFNRFQETKNMRYVIDRSLFVLLYFVHVYLQFIPPLIEEHKKNFQPDCIRDCIDAFLYEQKYRKGKEYFTNKQLSISCRDLFEAGTKTSPWTKSKEAAQILQWLTDRTCEGEEVMPNIYAAHFDPLTWQNPRQFNPGRHIDQDGKFLYSSKVIPFSLGSRACTGEHLARMEVFLIFVGVLQKFTIISGTPNLSSLTEGRFGIMYST